MFAGHCGAARGDPGNLKVFCWFCWERIGACRDSFRYAPGLRYPTVGKDRQDAPSAPTGRKLAVAEAAEALGISAEAVRSRVKWGTLPSVKDGSTVYVLLPADQTRPDTDRTETEHDRTADRSRSDADALISAKDETIAALREQLQAERLAHGEARPLRMAALERIPPAIEAPRDAPHAPQTVVEEPEVRGGTPSPKEAQEGAQRRSWWRRWFGFE